MLVYVPMGMTGEPPRPLVIYMGPREPNHNPQALVARALLTKPSVHHHHSENFKSRKIHVLFKMWQNIHNRKFTIKPLSRLHSVVYLHSCGEKGCRVFLSERLYVYIHVNNHSLCQLVPSRSPGTRGELEIIIRS